MEQRGGNGGIPEEYYRWVEWKINFCGARKDDCAWLKWMKSSDECMNNEAALTTCEGGYGASGVTLGWGQVRRGRGYEFNMKWQVNLSTMLWIRLPPLSSYVHDSPHALCRVGCTCLVLGGRLVVKWEVCVCVHGCVYACLVLATTLYGITAAM